MSHPSIASFSSLSGAVNDAVNWISAEVQKTVDDPPDPMGRRNGYKIAAASSHYRQFTFVRNLCTWADQLSFASSSDSGLKHSVIQPILNPRSLEYDYHKPLYNGSPLSSPTTHPITTFSINPEINRKLYIVKGDICCLSVSAVCCFTNETLDSQEGLSDRLLAIGGMPLWEQIQNEDRCRSGEARIVRAFCGGGHTPAPGGLCQASWGKNLALGCSYILYTVGPRFNSKYQIAAHNTLHGCFRECLKLLADQDLDSIAFPAIFSHQFPRDDLMHTTLRSIRRWVERLEKIESVVLVAENDEDVMLLLALMPLYFPRSPEEKAWGLNKLPRNLGNEFGEFEIEERKIRIVGGIGASADTEDYLTSDSKCYRNASAEPSSAINGFSSFPVSHFSNNPVDIQNLEDDGEIMGDIDLSFTESRSGLLTDSERRLQASAGARYDTTSTSFADYTMGLINNVTTNKPPGTEEEQEMKYLRLLRESEKPEMVSECNRIAQYRFVYRAGQDRAKRNVIVFCGALFPAAAFEWHNLLVYIVKMLDPYIHDRYALLYINAEVTVSANQPGIMLLRELWEVYCGKCENTLDAFWVLYPSLLFKTAYSCCWPFLSEHVWNSTKYLYSIEALEAYCDVSTLCLPRYVKEYDKRHSSENGNISFSFLGR